MSHVSNMDETCLKNEWVMSHIWMSVMSHMTKCSQHRGWVSCFSYELVMWVLKTDSGYPKDTGVNKPWQPLGIPFAITPIVSLVRESCVLFESCLCLLWVMCLRWLMVMRHASHMHQSCVLYDSWLVCHIWLMLVVSDMTHGSLRLVYRAIHLFRVYKRHVRLGWEGTSQRHKSTCDTLMLLNSTKNSPVAAGWNPQLLANWIGKKDFPKGTFDLKRA